ncbi:MAG: acyl-CoA desaturase [Bacteroidetes bacterium]|nr:acyl-CoA desaturase [Bacteroidota bacterium]
MSITSVRFNKKNQPEFFKELNIRVNNYFKDNNITKFGNRAMWFKTAFMLCLYFIPLGFMVFGFVQTTAMAFLVWVLMGLGMAGIGLSVMHDANHGSYSNNKTTNKIFGFVLNFLGGFHTNWKIQHNVLHHSYTNIHGLDEDIDKGVMRMSPDQAPNKAFRFQAYYATFLYSLLTIFWFLAKDFIQLSRYHKKDLLKTQGLSFRSALLQILFHKSWYIMLLIVLPMIMVPIPWWQTLLGFLMMHFIGGIILAFIFQAAHVIEETHFFKADENGSVENSWAIHQMKTTANFARHSGFFSWFIGGLNYQIEHHLFPNICHIHYAAIAPIVEQTAAEYNIPYYQHKTFAGALKSHFTLLDQLGTGSYDKKVAKAAVRVTT